MTWNSGAAGEQDWFWASFIGTVSGGAGSGVIASEEGLITVYRGVNSSAGSAFTNALRGTVKSRGGFFGHSNPLIHNNGLNGTISSKFTSWTLDKEVALNFAYRTNGQGVLLEMRVSKSILIKSPDTKVVNLFQNPGTVVSESEVLLRGTFGKISAKPVEFQAMVIPKLENNDSFCLIRAERTTGIILNNDNSKYLTTGTDYYKVFDTFEQLKAFVMDDQNECSNSLEYIVYNADGKFLQMMT